MLSGFEGGLEISAHILCPDIEFEQCAANTRPQLWQTKLVLAERDADNFYVRPAKSNREILLGVKIRLLAGALPPSGYKA